MKISIGKFTTTSIIVIFISIHLFRELGLGKMVSYFSNDNYLTYYLAYIPGAFIFILFYLLIIRVNGVDTPIGQFSFKNIKSNKIVMISPLFGIFDVMLTMGLCAVLVYLTALFSPDYAYSLFNFKIVENPWGVNSSLGSLTNITNILVFILVRGVLVPIYEELYFRGLILNALSEKYKLIFSIIITSAFFSLMHAKNFWFSTFVSSFILSLLYIKYNNLLVPIISHMTFNILIWVYEGLGGLLHFKNKTIENLSEFSAWKLEFLFLAVSAICYYCVLRKTKIELFKKLPNSVLVQEVREK